MCVLIGKYFDNIGWVAIKNRDRNYVPEISFKKKIRDGVEILYFWDDVTQYCEGVNSAGEEFFKVKSTNYPVSGLLDS